MATVNLRPVAIGFYDAWTLGAGTSKPVAVDPLEPVAHDDDSTYISKLAAAGASSQSFTLSTRPEMASVSAVGWAIRFKIISGTPESLGVFARMNGVDGAGSSATQNTDNVYTTFTGTLARPGGGDWSVVDLLNPTLEICVSNPAALAGNTRVTSLYVTVTYDPVPAQIHQAREILSRRLLMYRRAQEPLTTRASLLALDSELFDEIAVSDYGLPMQAALGDGSKDWQRTLTRKTREEITPETYDMGLTLKDLRRTLLTFWDVGRSLKSGGPSADGVARLDVGNTRLWTRATRAWIEDPSDGLVRQLEVGIEKMGPNGMMFESARSNQLLRSSFVSGLTGWTVNTIDGTGTADTAEPNIFEDGVTGFVARLLVGSFGGEIELQSTATASYLANARISVSVDYRENAASTGLHVRIIRNVDGRYWDGNAWQVAVQNLSVAASTVNARARWENIDVGTNATTITVRPVLLAGTAGRIAYVKHVQVEEGRWCSSRIVTDAAAVTRNLDSLKISNASGKRCWNRARGTALCSYTPDWKSGAAAGTVFPIYDLTFDASNWFRLFYTWQGGGGSSDQLSFEVRAGGTTYTALMLVALDYGVTYRMACRWTSSSGELDLSPLTISVFLDGVKGTDAVAAALPTEAASDLYIGGNNAVTQSADGAVTGIVLRQIVMTDGEIARGF